MRSESLKGRALFADIFRKGGRAEGARLKVFFLPGDDCRFSVTTPRTAGNAVRRNRFKRLLKEFYRLNRGRFELTGSVLVLLKKTGDETGVSEEFVELAAIARKRSLKTQVRPPQ